ncbi:hypothetical protein B0H11DRAFT_1680072, partial [Mycena galericulata]
TSASAAPTRRKSMSSAAAAPGERHPPQKKGYEDYVKHHENTFILFRRKCYENRALGFASPSTSTSSSKQCHADLSKTISQWMA